MRRREFITLFGGAAVAWPLVARAQQPAQPVVAFIRDGSADASARLVAAFRKGLNETGYVEGQNVTVEYHWLEGQSDRLSTLVADLVRRRVAVKNLRIDFHFGVATPDNLRTAVIETLATAPDLIVALGTAVTAVLHQQTRTVPIVFTVVSDPVGSGFVQSFAHPGGNITGFTNFLEPSLAAKWVELLKEIAQFFSVLNGKTTDGALHEENTNWRRPHRGGRARSQKKRRQAKFYLKTRNVMPFGVWH